MTILPLTHTNYITAYRAWFIRNNALDSLVAYRIWEPFKPMTEKKRLYFSEFSSLNLHKFFNFTLYGIYSFKNKLLFDKHMTLTFDMEGKVAIWGEIVEHEYGYRSQFAYPISLSNKSLALKYGCQYKRYYCTYEYDQRIDTVWSVY